LKPRSGEKSLENWNACTAQSGAVAGENADVARSPRAGNQAAACKKLARYDGLLSSPYEKTILEKRVLDNCLGLAARPCLHDFLARGFEGA